MGSTYLTAKMVVCTSLLILIALINGVQMEESLVADSSGDGELVDLKSPVSLIDDNGDIHTDSPTTLDPSTNASVTDLAEDSLLKASNESLFTTVIVNVTEAVSESTTTPSPAAPTEVTVATTTQSPQTNPPATESTKPDTTTVVSETTTVTTTTSTAMPTSVEDEVTTETEMETSTLDFEGTVEENMDDVAESTPKRSTTESTVLTPGAERSLCTFVEEDFTCRDELVCYGEGEIDCTDYDDEDTVVEGDAVKQVSTYAAKSNVMGKRPLADAAVSTDIDVKSSAKTEDYAEYDAEASDTIGTYPPLLVISHQRTFHHIRLPFNLRPVASTEVSPNATDEIPTTAMTGTEEAERISTSVTEQPENRELMGNAMATYSTVASENTEGSTENNAAESTPATSELSESSSDLTSAENLTTDKNVTPSHLGIGGLVDDLPKPLSNDEGNGEITTQSDETISSTTPELLTKERRSIVKLMRRKRQDSIFESNSSSSQSQSFHVAALESTQRKLRVKVCRLSGDIVCTPTPTVTMCKGKSYCQAITSTADTTESATTRGVETWAIIVIVVCALSGFLTICLLIYLVVTSCKKLKVQPSIEVTTLNYINRGALSNEVA